ncbi:MAG: CDP-glucose 4,6-dehydratase [Desulfobacter postgatei]|uniref:CDP-glucose 4,6-dehydratase n=1 Tax=Desulfobacter postgatei TaxID=2293 RepID=A0A2G6MRE0_9BACT|nr:MAG: CDP-glucose 4,6-dehydratase [Desulfobacter postgatei]
MFKGCYKNKKVLITGHTGFKGSWLALWLSTLSADIIGYSLTPPTEPNHFRLLNMELISLTGDIRDLENLKQIFKAYQPEIIFHLAAQAIVKDSYKDPVTTFSSNVMGTVNILEAARGIDSVKAIINVTSDKCYENKEWAWGYREIDPMGGYDPYSASKGCTEILTRCWQKTFFNSEEYCKTHQTLLASTRAGNVIGGGDWAPHRLIPDIVRAIHQHEKVKIRNPHSIRPWQHVLEPLSGYLLLGQKLLEGEKDFAQAWNFGPSFEENITVEEVVQTMKHIWPEMEYERAQIQDQSHEAGILKLDTSKARQHLKWKPVWDCSQAIQYTAEWYKEFYNNGSILSFDQLEAYKAMLD